MDMTLMQPHVAMNESKRISKFRLQFREDSEFPFEISETTLLH